MAGGGIDADAPSAISTGRLMMFGRNARAILLFVKIFENGQGHRR